MGEQVAHGLSQPVGLFSQKVLGFQSRISVVVPAAEQYRHRVFETGGARERDGAAYRAALEERTRERVPPVWAPTFGNQGLALMNLAERTIDTAMAQTAFLQIEAAIEACARAAKLPPPPILRSAHLVLSESARA